MSFLVSSLKVCVVAIAASTLALVPGCSDTRYGLEGTIEIGPDGKPVLTIKGSASSMVAGSMSPIEFLKIYTDVPDGGPNTELVYVAESTAGSLYGTTWEFETPEDLIDILNANITANGIYVSDPIAAESWLENWLDTNWISAEDFAELTEEDLD